MLDLIGARRTSNLLRSEASNSGWSEGRSLRAEVISRELLTPEDRHEMYDLFEAYFEGASFDQFNTDLSEKESAIVLRDLVTERIVGFSTLMCLRATVGGRSVVGFFSGDTVIAREHWGSSLLGRVWLRTVFSMADQLGPDEVGYWFLICSGYKTWRYLPVFFLDYIPHPNAGDCHFEKEVLAVFAAQKFGHQYISEKGIVRFDRAAPLRAGVAEVTEQRLRDPMVDFFARANPGHAQGDELACLARVARSNLTRAGLRLLEAGAR